MNRVGGYSAAKVDAALMEINSCRSPSNSFLPGVSLIQAYAEMTVRIYIAIRRINLGLWLSVCEVESPPVLFLFSSKKCADIYRRVPLYIRHSLIPEEQSEENRRKYPVSCVRKLKWNYLFLSMKHQRETDEGNDRNIKRYINLKKKKKIKINRFKQTDYFFIRV